MTMATMTAALQRACVTHLNQDTDLMSRITGVFDDVPQGTALPYLTFANSVVTDRATRHLDIAEVALTLHIWSDYAGRKQILELMERVETLLQRDALILESGHAGRYAMARTTRLCCDDGSKQLTSVLDNKQNKILI
jgi:hypothetical protein